MVHHFTPRFDEKTSCRFVVGACGRFGFGQGAFEVAVKCLTPDVLFCPRHFAAFDHVQLFTVSLDAHGTRASRNVAALDASSG